MKKRFLSAALVNGSCFVSYIRYYGGALRGGRRLAVTDGTRDGRRKVYTDAIL